MSSATGQLGIPNTVVQTDTVAQFVAPGNRIQFTGCAPGGSTFGAAPTNVGSGTASITGTRIQVHKGRLLSSTVTTGAFSIFTDDGAAMKAFSAPSGNTVLCRHMNSLGYMVQYHSAVSQIGYSQDYGLTWSTSSFPGLTGSMQDFLVSETMNYGVAIQSGSNIFGTFIGASASGPTLPSTATSNRLRYFSEVDVFVILTNKGMCWLQPPTTVINEILLDATNGFLDVTYSKALNLWVAVGNNGHIWTASGDSFGRPPVAGSWTQRTSGVAAALKEIQWVPAKTIGKDAAVSFTARFIALGTGVYVTSTDGVTWSNCTGLTGNFDRDSLAWGLLPRDGAIHLVAINNLAAAAPFYSTDGVSWTASAVFTGAHAGPSSGVGSVVFGMKNFVFRDGNGSTTWASTDGGVTWISSASFPNWLNGGNGNTIGTGSDTIVIGSVSGELLRLKSGQGVYRSGTYAGKGGYSGVYGLRPAANNVGIGWGEGGVGGFGTIGTGQDPRCFPLGAGGATGSGGTGGGGAARQAKDYPNGWPTKCPGGSGSGALNTSIGGSGGASAFCFGGDARYSNGSINGTPIGWSTAQGPGGGAGGCTDGGNGSTTAGGGGGESAIRLPISVVPGELITIINGVSQFDAGVAASNHIAAMDGFIAAEYAA